MYIYVCMCGMGGIKPFLGILIPVGSVLIHFLCVVEIRNGNTLNTPLRLSPVWTEDSGVHLCNIYLFKCTLLVIFVLGLSSVCECVSFGSTTYSVSYIFL